MKKLLIPAVIILAAATIWFCFFRDNEENKVRRALASLADSASKRAGEKTSTMIIKSQILASNFAEKCGLLIDDKYFAGEYSPEEISNQMLRARTFFHDFSLDFYDTEIDFPSTNEARIAFTGHLTGTLKNGDRINEARELVALLRNDSGKWKFYSFKIRPILRK